MLKFEPCDPLLNPHGSSPVMLKRDDLDYDTHTKHMTTAYAKLENAIGLQLKKQKAKEALAWLLQEYNNPRCIVWQQEDPAIQAKQLDVFLRELNYLEQRQELQKAIQGTDVAKVILVEANGTFTQRWLVKRLSLEVPNCTLNKGFSISAKSKWDRDLKYFWNTLSKYADDTETPEEIIQVLCDRCLTQPLIMAIHGIQTIKPSTLQTLLSNFWEALLQKLSEQPWCSDRCDCVLFLTTNLGTDHHIADRYGINLSPWEFVTVEHMQQWLKPREVTQFLAKCSGESAEDACLDLLPKGKQPPDNLSPPEEMLTTICTTCELDGPAELETYWKIAS